MARKMRVGIILGRKNPNLILSNFTSMQKNFDIVVYAFSDQISNMKQFSSMTLKVFEEVTDMPGYMRGLEEDLNQVDLIIAVDTSQISSFQGSRAADKYKKKFLVYSTEWQTGVYDNYKNVMALQFGILEQTQSFLVPTKSCEDYLLHLGVEPEKITFLPYKVDENHFYRDLDKRTKFRNYLNVTPQEKLILVEADLVAEFELKEILEAFGKLQFAAKLPVRILFVGSGVLANELKYKAYDLGLGSQIMFLHQDITPFAQDLYSSCDAAINPDYSKKIELAVLPFHIFFHAACQLPQMSTQSCLTYDMLEGKCITLKRWNHVELYNGMDLLLNSLEEKKLLPIFNSYKFSLKSDVVMEEILQDFRLNLIGQKDYSELVREVEFELKSGNLVQVENLMHNLKSTTDSQSEKSEFCRLMGDFNYIKGLHEQSLSQYQNSLKYDPRNYKSYTGLGFLSWQSHSDEDGISFFKKSLAIYPHDSQAMLGIGLIHKRVGLYKSAMFWFEKSLMIDDKLSALAAFAQSCDEFFDTKYVISSLEKIIDTLGDLQPLLVSLGNAYLKNGLITEGKEMLNKALQVGAA